MAAKRALKYVPIILMVIGVTVGYFIKVSVEKNNTAYIAQSIIENKTFFGNENYSVCLKNEKYVVYDINNQVNYDLFSQQIPLTLQNIDPQVLLDNILYFTSTNNYNQQQIYSVDLSTGMITELSRFQFNSQYLMGIDKVFNINVDSYFNSYTNMKRYELLIYHNSIIKLYPNYIEYDGRIIINDCVTEVGYGLYKDLLYYYNIEGKLCQYSLDSKQNEIILDDVIIGTFQVTNDGNIYFTNLSDGSCLYKYDHVEGIHKISEGAVELFQCDGLNIFYTDDRYIYNSNQKRIAIDKTENWYVSNGELIFGDFDGTYVRKVDGYTMTPVA